MLDRVYDDPLLSQHTYYLKFVDILKVSNAVKMSMVIICSHHLTSRAVCVALTDTLIDGLAYGKINVASSDISLLITSWNNAVDSLKSHVPVSSPVRDMNNRLIVQYNCTSSLNKQQYCLTITKILINVCMISQSLDYLGLRL